MKIFYSHKRKSTCKEVQIILEVPLPCSDPQHCADYREIHAKTGENIFRVLTTTQNGQTPKRIIILLINTC